MRNGFEQKQTPMKPKDVWPELKRLLNLPDELVRAVRIDIEFDSATIDIEVRKFAVANASGAIEAMPPESVTKVMP